MRGSTRSRCGRSWHGARASRASSSSSSSRRANDEGTRMSYDANNIFARILRGEIPCAKIYEDEHVLAFKDIRPQAKVHALVIPKGQYVSAQDFGEKASEKEIAAVQRAISKIARELGVADTGYRLIAN